jgi:ABC-type taurine transport system substrate-binding protein
VILQVAGVKYVTTAAQHPMATQKRARRFFTPVLSAVLVFFLGAGGEAAELNKFTLGYSTVGPAGKGLWMAKEIGASVMSLVNRPYYRLWVQPEITRMKDLHGKILGVSRFGSVTDNMTRILLRRYKLEGAVQVRQMGGTTEMAAAFQRRQIDGAVISALRVNAPMRMLVDLAELGIRYSNIVIAVSRDYQRRQPDTVEAMARAYLEGVAAANRQKERAFKVIQKYTRLQDQKLID